MKNIPFKIERYEVMKKIGRSMAIAYLVYDSIIMEVKNGKVW